MSLNAKVIEKNQYNQSAQKAGNTALKKAKEGVINDNDFFVTSLTPYLMSIFYKMQKTCKVLKVTTDIKIDQDKSFSETLLKQQRLTDESD